ncbi:MAG: hypothetical protein U0904_11715 [Candidatus Nanopelagicales bacterium]|nr:hypothetical protein [Candidatus Nanopelagicales bacterium]
MTASAEVPESQRLLIDLCLSHLVMFHWRTPGTMLISRRGIGAILDELDARGIRILGLEGFELDGNVIHPRIDLIYDADRLPGFPSPQDFIATWPPDVWIDVTIELGCGWRAEPVG